MSKQNSNDLTRFTGLWEKTSQNGNVRYEGVFNAGIRVVIFKNTRKEEGSNQPDLEAFFAPVTKEGEQAPENNLIRITGLWEKTSQNGNVRYEGRVNNGLRILMFKNNRKEPGSNQPDWDSFFAPVRTSKPEEGTE